VHIIDDTCMLSTTHYSRQTAPQTEYSKVDLYQMIISSTLAEPFACVVMVLWEIYVWNKLEID